MSIYDKYETVIGLETHVQLATKSKAFCGDAIEFGASPNTHISAISLAYPGTLPKVNHQQIEFAIRLGLALGSEINLENRFDRKNYFYADLPKGYQITQDRLPICVGGALKIRVKGKEKSIRIHHIHMEEDAGKSIHDLDAKHSMIDLNRAGTPLLEVVSEPDLRSEEEVDAFMTTMRQLVRYLEISDGNMEQASLRCDCNVSVRLKGASEYGQRCEIKNLNSMRFARKAIQYERKRQIDLIESGGEVQQNTLNFDPVTGKTSPLRSKENAHDYRYFPEPDLPPVVVSEQQVEQIKNALPPLPNELFETFTQTFKLSEYDTNILLEEKNSALYFVALVQATPHKKAAANLMINKILPYLNEERKSIQEFPIDTAQLAALIELIQSDQVSNSIAYQQLFPELLKQPDIAPLKLAEQLNLLQSNDDDFLQDLITQILEQHPDKVKAYQKGKKGLIGFFMGDLMKKSKGKANPKEAKKLLAARLEN
ncbi:MAG: Asp-tRNA(Asn)/Glu-tRNA(Gln) amidotransferase subunit GatB [Bacteroidota bacterium]